MPMSISDSMDQLLDRFDAAWNDPTPPRIEDYLAKADPDKRLALLIELVRIDLERRLAAGEKVRLENDYLPRFPELAVEPLALVTLVKHEFAVRRRTESDLMPAEYLARFPQCQTELVAQLPTLDEMLKGEQQSKSAQADAPEGLDLRGYQMIETLGRGGMGEVYRCIDPALGRDLAIKVMKAEYCRHPEAAGRFVREARVTGSLQHPGIVPIHNLGRLSDGRLHYTMRLVRGQTFADILQEEAGKPEQLPYLLSIFEKLCQAVAYAHSKRVIHRDLKPHNVMVGRFGEVQVMDWGLAKVLTPGERGCVSAPSDNDAAGTRIVTEADTPSDLSRMGSGMGTPAYMPPEQALGEWDAVDEHADVFALGSILCEILTGEPAYSGTDGNEVYRRARRGDMVEAMQRLQQCGADAALTLLCRECLSPRREDRPRDAAAVAKRVAAYQSEVQERLRKAEVERAEALTKAREGRKQRRLLIALVVALLAGGALSTWQAVRATAERDAKEVALGKEKAAAEAERQANESAQARLGELAKSNEVLASIFRDLDPSAEKMGGPSLRQQLSQHLEQAAKRLDEAAIGDALTVARLEFTLGSSLVNLGKAKWAIELLSKAARTLEVKLGPDHPDTLTCRDDLAEAYADVGRTAEAVRLREQTLKHREFRLGDEHPDTLQSRNYLALAYLDFGCIAEAILLFEQTLKQREATLGPGHPDTIQSRGNLGAAYQRAGRTAEAIPLHKQTLKHEETKLGTDHPYTLRSRNNLACAYQSVGRTTEAVRLHEQNLKQSEARLGLDHPDTLTYRNNLATAYDSAGRTGEAIHLYERTLKQMEAKHGADHPDTLLSMFNLGVAYRTAGQLKEAIYLLETAFERGRKRSGGLPALLLSLPVNLALTYDQAGEFGKSEAHYRDLLEQARRQFGKDDPRTVGPTAALSLNLLLQHKYIDAESLLLDCLKVCMSKQPNDWTTFGLRSWLGAALLGQKKYTEAEPLLLQGYEGMKARQAKIPPQSKVRVTEALERLVQLYEATEQKDKAADWRKKLQETKAAQKKPKS